MTQDLQKLFQQFTQAVSADNRIPDQLAAWSLARRQWRDQWTARGPAPEQALQRFVAHSASAGRDRWVHPIADEAPELDTWRKDAAGRADARELAVALVRAVEQIERDSASTPDACSALARVAGGSGVPFAAFSPALSALDPNRFVAVCDAWLRPLGEHEGSPMPTEIAAFGTVNAAALRWLSAAEGDGPPAALAAYPTGDRFGVFCGWVARKSSETPNARFDVTKKKYKDWPPMW